MGIIIGLQYFAARTSRNALRQAQDELIERQRNETALRLSEKRYREVFENTSDCMFLLDVLPENKFKVVRFNPAEEKSRRHYQRGSRRTDDTGHIAAGGCQCIAGQFPALC